MGDELLDGSDDELLDGAEMDDEMDAETDAESAAFDPMDTINFPAVQDKQSELEEEHADESDNLRMDLAKLETLLDGVKYSDDQSDDDNDDQSDDDVAPGIKDVESQVSNKTNS